MGCIVAFIVLSFLGIFSASHRQLAIEAFGCVFRRIRLRPCDTGFNIKIKAGLVGWLMKRSSRLASLVQHHFELLSWAFMVVMVVSSGYFLYGVYNFYAWGNCGGPNSSSFCVFDPTGANNQTSSLLLSSSCTVDGVSSDDLDLSPIELSSYPTLNPNGNNDMVFIGCFGCEYTRETYPRVRDLIGSDTSFTFVHLPVHDDVAYLGTVDYCVQQLNPDRYYQMVDEIFAMDRTTVAREADVMQMLGTLGIDVEQVQQCRQDEGTVSEVAARQEAVAKTGIYGTPTVFVQKIPLVGPKPDRVYMRLLGKRIF